MKTKGMIILVMLFACISGYAQDSLFDKLTDKEDITQVTVTKSLLNLMPSMATSVDMNGVDMKDIVTKLEQIDIFSTKNEKSRSMMRNETNKHFNNNKSYEVLMKVKDEKDNIVFYGQKENNFIKSLIMFVDGDNESVLIRLLGKFTTEDIQNMMKGIDKE